MIYASKDEGTPYIPARPVISGALTGLAGPARVVPASAKVAKTVMIAHNLRVYDKQRLPSQGSLVLKELNRSHWNQFKKARQKGREHVMVLSAKGIHPLAFGPYCNAEFYKTWSSKHFPDPRFTDSAEADKHFCPTPTD